MIKAEVSVVGTVMQPTQTKKYSQGGYFFSSTLKTSVPQAGGGFKEVNVSISAPQNESAGLDVLSAGQHVSLKGTLHFRKSGDLVYLNMLVKESGQADPGLADGISGDLSMIGAVGSRGVEMKTSKKGKPFMVFSAYSGDGDKDNRVFTWVRFTRFTGIAEPFLAPKAWIEATGSLELQFFQDKLSISCIAREVKPYTKNSQENAHC